MGSLRTNSFVMGVTVASVTWAVILYLYFSLVQEAKLSSEFVKKNLPDESKFNAEKVIDSIKKQTMVPADEIIKRNRNSLLESSELKKNPWKKYETDMKRKKWKSDMKENFANPPKKYKKFSSADTPDQDLLAELGLVKTKEDQQEKEKGYRLHAFNTLISSRLSYHRSIPDTRHKRCQDIHYPVELPHACIIVCFYREDHSALLRTIHSILDRTPKDYLHELLLIDDTDEEKYHAEVEEEIKGISTKIRLLKTPRREGLIRARVFGARHASGQVLIFLDSHVEVNVGWIEPLLARIKENRTHVVTPIIDVISPDTFEYTASPLVRGGFNWGLHFKWDTIPSSYFYDKKNFVNPIRSPTMAGGLFAIDRIYFKELGEYDEGMDIWGGENLEMSFRIWMCGGNLEILPCSRVGHIFRKRRPYGGPGGHDSLMRNSLRVAHVWMDEYKENFFKIRPEAKKMDFGNVTARENLRKDLKCQSFTWYLKNIYPELQAPGEPSKNNANNGQKQFQPWHKRQRNYINKWQIRLTGTNFCIESEDDTSKKRSRLILSKCAEWSRQIFYNTDRKELVLDKLLCLEAQEPNPHMGKCHEMGGDQEWKIGSQMGVALYNMALGLCLAAQEIRSGSYIVMAMCSTPNLATWDLVDVP